MEAMENIKVVLKGNIKAHRKRLDINQEELAERSGLSTAYIKNIERGVSWPSPESMEALAKGLSCPIEELFSDVHKPKPRTFAETLPVNRLLELLDKKLSSIPSEFIEEAAKLPGGDEVWERLTDMIKDRLEDIEAEQRQALKKT